MEKTLPLSEQDVLDINTVIVLFMVFVCFCFSLIPDGLGTYLPL